MLGRCLPMGRISVTTSADEGLTYFTDPIHGQIAVTDKELRIIGTPAFQRLRRIKQLGNVQFVFPGAVHTRFSHSLGTMHLAGRYFDALFKHPKHDSDLDYLRMTVRMAGLLHDVGHGPFSHLFEKMLRKSVDGSQKTTRCKVSDLADELSVPKAWLKEEKTDKFFREELEHEHYSLGIIRHIFSSIGLDDNLAQDVSSLISDDLKCSNKFTEHARNLCSRFFSNASVDSLMRCLHFVISGEVDVDKLDYLARDAYFCGTKIGSIDTEFLLNSLKISSQNFDEDEKKQCYIEISGSAIPAFEQVLISRKQMFNRVYYHRVNLAFDKIMEKIVDRLVLKGSISFPKDYQSFIKMTDEWLEERIRDVLNDDKFKQDSQTTTLAQMYLTRSMPKRVEVCGVSKEDEIVPHYRVKDREKELRKLYKNDMADPEIVTAPLKELTKLERDIKSKEGTPHILRIRPDTIENQAISVSYISDLLRSSLWRDVSTRMIVFQSYEKSAELRELTKKAELLPRK